MANSMKFGNGQWATKEDSILAYNDENANFKPLPFTTSRASTATRVNKAGLLETVASGIPRVDYLGNTKGAYLLEPRSTNLVLNSSEGQYGNSPASTLNTISPDGTLNAFRPIPNDLADRYQYNISSNTYATNTKLTYSWYRKRLEVPFNSSYVGDLNIANLINTTQVGLTNQIQSDVNGFDRFQAVLNITDGSVTAIVRGYFGYIIGLGNSSIAYFGHQLEQGSYATSYIPTAGSAITRLAETANGSGNTYTFNDSEGVLFAEIKTPNSGINMITISDGTTSNAVRIDLRSSTTIVANFAGNGTSINIGAPVVFTEFKKIAFKYKNNDFALWVNGIEVATNASALPTPSSSFSELKFSRGNNSYPFYGEIKQLEYYNTALTDAELAKLTTI